MYQNKKWYVQQAWTARPKVYAGGNARPGMTNLSNPWHAYSLPKGFVATRMPIPCKTSNDQVEWEVQAIPEREQAHALDHLRKHTNSRMSRMFGSLGPPMWDGVLTREDLENADQRSQHFKYLASAPPRDPGRKCADAVVIDTESVPTGFFKGKGRSSLASFSVVDFLAGETLLDVAVLPDHGVTARIKRINGIVPHFYHNALRDGNVVYGVKGAQEMLFQVIDAETIIVGHSILNEQRALYLAHDLVYDTQITCKARRIPAGLKSASPVPCQSGSHSALEDTLATRELALELLRLGKYKNCPDSEPEFEIELDLEMGLNPEPDMDPDLDLDQDLQPVEVEDQSWGDLSYSDWGHEGEVSEGSDISVKANSSQTEVSPATSLFKKPLYSEIFKDKGGAASLSGSTKNPSGRLLYSEMVKQKETKKIPAPSEKKIFLSRR